jgi:hypothetical protein
MIDACIIERLTPSGTFNSTTLAEDPPAAATIYEGACQFNSPPLSSSSDLEAIGIHQTESTIRVVIPIGATAVTTGDRLTVTAASLFPELVAMSGVITVGSRTSFSTVREVYADLVERYPQ